MIIITHTIMLTVHIHLDWLLMNEKLSLLGYDINEIACIRCNNNLFSALYYAWNKIETKRPHPTLNTNTWFRIKMNAFQELKWKQWKIAKSIKLVQLYDTYNIEYERSTNSLRKRQLFMNIIRDMDFFLFFLLFRFVSRFTIYDTLM